MIQITESAADKIRGILQQDPQAQGKPLRIQVRKGGCSGYEYSFLFDEKQEGDLESAFDGVRVVVDPQSAEFLKGATVDYVEGLAESGFKIQNPNIKSSCACGQSHSF